MRERLARFLADVEWCNIFPYYAVRHILIGNSDHALIMLTSSNYYDRGCDEKDFKFEILLLSSDECWKIVAEAYASCIGEQADHHLSICED